ncbi:hypothetical protein STRTUCAR8_08599 [Streptomyces turgidiscabies Car8]|uniref:Uncharacterized protein n=1 Tax=Streptomyces turgidiscabies (strain Car8) TaxID=698760 RepID=L7F9C9_STRT8|nr:hypothetical protein [Streptomyces turgidiscabies]ELP67636.1 hypothetical protein STRTUCAR8_08599 [Streptomyces turgidiscabies Car8]
MNDRIPLDDMTSDQLDQLYDELDRAETENAELRDALAHCHEREPRRRAEAANGRVRALTARWVKAGPPPLGTPVSRWWDARLAELNTALDDPKDQT